MGASLALSTFRSEDGISVTPFEIAEVILKLLTLIGLIGIAAGVMRRQFGEGDFPLYPALGFTAVAGALWIIVSMLLQR